MDALHPQSSAWRLHLFAPVRWFLNYLDSGMTGSATTEVRYVNAITLIGTPNILAAILIEDAVGNPAMALFMSAVALCAILNVLLLRFTHDASLAATIILLIMLAMLTVMLIDGMFQNTAPIWYATFPALAFFFKGKREGLLWLGALLCLLLILMLAQSLNLLHSPFSNPALALVFASTVTVGMMVYVYESLRAKAEASLQQAREELHHLAHTDMLTGLPNRTAFYQHLPKALLQTQRLDCRLAVLFIDLDNFKPINDTYGHESGDELLQQAANRLRQHLRSDDFIARFGGDEFVAILPSVTEQQEISVVANKLIGALAAPFAIQGHQCRIGVSIGVGLYPDCASTVDNLVQLADHAMYTAKLSGKNAYAVCPIREGNDASPYKGKCLCNKTCLTGAQCDVTLNP
jgi:diguanylate cyclase (GGDEF)-like protein